MPAQKRHHTDYPGVYYILGIFITSKKTKKPDKIFYIDYRKDGRRIQEKAGRQSQGMTAARASRQRADKINGRTLPNNEQREAEKAAKLAEKNRYTIFKLWEEYKRSKPNLKGIVTDQNRFENYIMPSFGQKEPHELLPLDIDRLRLSLLKKRTPGTVKNVLELLRRIINFGTKKQLCTGIGFKIEMPKVNNIKTEDLPPEQMQTLLEAIEKDSHPQAGPIMLLALFSGMRRGEMFRLKWEDIDFDRGFIKIRDPKGVVDQTIPLNDGAREVLEGQPKTNETPYVFPGRSGNRRTDIKKAVNRIKMEAGLPKDFRPLHGLRHVYASMLASSGQVDLYTLQKLMTHKSPMMTQRYAHLRDEALKKASNLATDLIEDAKGKSLESNNVVKLKDRVR